MAEVDWAALNRMAQAGITPRELRILEQEYNANATRSLEAQNRSMVWMAQAGITEPMLRAFVAEKDRQGNDVRIPTPVSPDEPFEEEKPEKPTTPTIDFRAEAAALFPWLTGGLLDEFANFWADTGSANAALGRLRNTATYKQTFKGIFREDGTMRMDENSYMSTKAGFREALSEFGRNPAQYEGLFVTAIENEMGAAELMEGMGDAYRRFTEPGANTENGLFDSFLGSFINSGSAVEALEDVRSSDAYDQVFQGNRRDDGTIRMDETEWFAYKRGWSRTLAGFGLNPDEFLARGRLGESVEGEVSIQELNQRLQITQDGILDNVEAVRQFYGRAYGLDVSAEAILGMAIDPDVQKDVLERRITAGQIGGEASAQGFLRSVDRAEQLARLGVGQSQARELYGNAARRLPGLSATTSRFNLGSTSLGQFEDVGLGVDAAGGQRFERALQREQSNFSSTADTRRDQGGGLTGLAQR